MSETKQSPVASAQYPVASTQSLAAGNWRLEAGSANVERLRREFDATFAAPPSPLLADTVDFLAIRVAGEALAVRVSDLAGLGARRKIVPLSAEDTPLLGIAGIQGHLVPVYSLAMLLGQDRPEEPQWLGIVERDAPVGLAFGELEGHLRVSSEAIHAPQTETRKYVRGALRLASEVRYILDLKSLVTAIRERAAVSGGHNRR